MPVEGSTDRPAVGGVRPLAAAIAVLAACLLLGAGCGTKENRQADEDRRRAEELCVKVPSRSFGEIFRAVSASGAEPDAARGLVDFAANGFADPPDAVKADVELVVGRFRATNGAAGTADEPDVAAAIVRIDAWLAASCPPPSTVPVAPATTAGGAAGSTTATVSGSP